MALSTRNTGASTESLAELEALEAVANEARRAAVDSIGTSAFADLNAAAFRAGQDVDNFELEPGETTYYDATGNEIDVDEFDVTRLEQATAGTDEPVENIVAPFPSNTAPEDDPSSAAVDNRIETAATATLTPEELDDIEEAEELAARRAANDQLLAESAARGQAAEREEILENERENDWRVRLHLADDARYLYKGSNPGILAPLRDTDGIIFPYTPTIQVQYNADYANYDLVHSNYRGYFYTGSQVQNVIITATFTANDVEEANYMLAALHFLKSCTKMFYGKDQTNRGMPPPIVFLTGLGEYQFKNHPCVVNSMHYNLPDDVDYIPCGKPESFEPPQKPPNPNAASTSLRLAATDTLSVGGQPISRAALQQEIPTYTKATYVPTKIDVNFTMLPIQTRDQVSNEFSLEDYASGELLKKGFW